MESGNSNGSRTLKRMKLSYKEVSIQLSVNPEEYTQREPSRSTVTQTKGGAWVDAWGAGLIEVSFSGTTGVRGGTTDIDVGYNRWIELRNLFRQLYQDVELGKEVKDFIKLYNFTDNEYFECYPSSQGIELSRSKSRPHIYHYSVSLIVVKNMGEKESNSVGVIGNPFSSENSIPLSSGGVYSNSFSIITKSTTSTASSGKSDELLDSLVNSEVDTSLSLEIKVKPIEVIIEGCKRLCIGIEPLIGGREGKLSPPTSHNCKKGIKIQSGGGVENVFKFSVSEFTEDKSILLKGLKFVPRLSVQSSHVSKLIDEYSPEVMSSKYWPPFLKSETERVARASTESFVYDSTIYSELLNLRFSSLISKKEENYIKIILLETFGVYIDAYEVASRIKTTPSITVEDLGTLIGNLQSVILYFELNSMKGGKGYNHYDLCSEVRNLEYHLEIYKSEVISCL